MARTQTVRFASGSPETPFSSVWRFIVSNNDVYIGASKDLMGIIKMNLHHSGVWVFAATAQSGAVFEGGNRRAKEWRRPTDHASWITRGPSIFAPHTSLGHRYLLSHESTKIIHWYAAPSPHETIEFSFYFIKKGARTQWLPQQTVIAERTLANGGKITLLASVRPSTKEFEDTVEAILVNNVFGLDKTGPISGSLLWITDSRDRLAVPVIVDLPMPVQFREG